MTVKNAWYPKSMPTKIVIESTDGAYYSADITPFRLIQPTELQKLAIFTPVMGDEIPEYTMRLYGLAKTTDNRLRQIRVDTGMTQTALAEAAGINIRQIQKIEAGEIQIENITLKNAKALAVALNTSIDSLLD